MNTPAHIAASLLFWRKEPGWSAAAAVTAGAILPDLPMFGFYAYQKANETSENKIWSELYFHENWQLLFDIFNSIPAAFALTILFQLLNFRIGSLLMASALLHMVCDFPVHNDDAHRHLIPFSNWRFLSPVSYWDPKHFGGIFVWFELVFAISSCSFVAFRSDQLPMRVVSCCTLAVYFLFICFAVYFWL